jgi:thioredoxin-dependent peroxiredoxin
MKIHAMCLMLLAVATVAGCAAQSLAPVHEDAASARSPILKMSAPDFTLPDQNGQPVTLSKMRGQWVVLYFYPKDDTPGCTCEATEFTALLVGFKKMNAKLYGISSDSVQSHKLFIEHYKIGIDLLSDVDHKVMKEYGAWVTAYLGDKPYERVIRTTMIINPDGLIAYHWPEVIPQGHADRVVQKLAQLQALAPKAK